MERNKNNQSISKFLLPFYFNYTGKKDDMLPFEQGDFRRYDIRTKYLAKSVHELFLGDKEAACKCYYLLDKSREKYNLPPRFRNIMMHSEMKGCCGDFCFSILANRIIYFSTGIGFLETEIQYGDDNPSNITDIGFCLANVFTNEHDSGKLKNNLTFSHLDGDNKIEFSLKNALLDLLRVKFHDRNLVIFPSTERRRMMVYHSLICQNVHDENKYLYSLCNGLHNNIFYDEKMDDDVVFSSIANQKWSASPSGIASIAIESDDDEHAQFLVEHFKKSTLYDYFYIFILVAHEREILLKYNYDAVNNRMKPNRLISMRHKLIDLDLHYTYNTISTELSYQRFYTNISSIFNISCLEQDIKNVIETVESHVNERKDRKTNTLLTAISVLAVFSVLTDGIAFVDRIQDGNPFGILQWMIILIVGIFIFIALMVLKRK